MTTAQIVAPKDALGSMVEMLTRLKPQMRAALPKHLSPERMARIVTTTLRRTPKLLECTPLSLAGAIIQSCQLGLEPDGFLGEYYLTPRRLQGIWNVVGIPGYRGLMKLARQSGDVDWIMPHCVYEGDEFHYEYGDKPHLTHKPGKGPREDAKISHAYAVARLRTGSTLFWVMEKPDIDRVRDRYAAARDDGPWITHYPEMAMKTPTRRLCKFLPQSTALGRAVALDEAAEAGLPQGLEALVDAEDLQLPARPSTLDRIGEALEKSRPSAPAGPDSGEHPETHAPGPVGRRAPRRFPKEVEKPARITEPPQEAEMPPPRGEAAPLDHDAPSHVFPPLEHPGERVDPFLFPAVTPDNAFELLQAATSEEELNQAADHVRDSAVFRGWNEPQRGFFREAVNLTRKRLPTA